MNRQRYAPLFAGGLLVGVLAMIESGRRFGRRQLVRHGEKAYAGLSAIEAAIFGLLGLLIAFSFSGAMSRFDARRQLIVDESNAIGTAWLRLDLLAPNAQASLRELFRRYLDARLEVYRKLPDVAAAQLQFDAATKMEGEIWERAISGGRESNSPQIAMLLLPAVNQVIDLANSELRATRRHTPSAIFGILALLALASSFIAGLALAASKSRHWIHTLIFTVVIASIVYLIVDIELPLLGLIRIVDMNENLVELRQSMMPKN